MSTSNLLLFPFFIPQSSSNETSSGYSTSSEPRSNTALSLAETALPIVNKILHFSAFTSDVNQQCKIYLPKLIGSDDTQIVLQLTEGHDDLLPLFNNILQELILSTIIRILPILELSVVELFKDGLAPAEDQSSTQQTASSKQEEKEDNSGSSSSSTNSTNTLSRLFVSMHRIAESAKLPARFQRYIICSLLSNFSLCLFETLLLNQSLLTAEIGRLLDEKIERLITWFGANSEYGYWSESGEILVCIDQAQNVVSGLTDHLSRPLPPI